MAEDIEFLRQLIEEAHALPPHNGGTTMADMAMNDWSVWTKKPKTPQRRDADIRAAYVLSRLNERYPRVFTHEAIPRHIRDAAEMYKKQPSRWNSAYEDREGDYPIYHAAEWMQSLPSAVYATGRMLGNEVDKAVYGAMSSEGPSGHVPDKTAASDFEYAVNTLTGGATEAMGVLPKGRSYWHDQASVPLQQGRKQRLGFFPSDARDEEVSKSVYESMPELETGEKFLTRSGAHPAYAKIAGPAMDSFLSFPSSIGPALSAVRAGKPLAALADIALDVALSNPDIAINAAKKYSEGKLPWAE